jgi:hypothetical protein
VRGCESKRCVSGSQLPCGRSDRSGGFLIARLHPFYCPNRSIPHSSFGYCVLLRASCDSLSCGWFMRFASSQGLLSPLEMVRLACVKALELVPLRAGKPVYVSILAISIHLVLRMPLLPSHRLSLLVCASAQRRRRSSTGYGSRATMRCNRYSYSLPNPPPNSSTSNLWAKSAVAVSPGLCCFCVIFRWRRAARTSGPSSNSTCRRTTQRSTTTQIPVYLPRTNWLQIGLQQHLHC